MTAAILVEKKNKPIIRPDHKKMPIYESDCPITIELPYKSLKISQPLVGVVINPRQEEERPPGDAVSAVAVEATPLLVVNAMHRMPVRSPNAMGAEIVAVAVNVFLGLALLREEQQERVIGVESVSLFYAFIHGAYVIQYHKEGEKLEIQTRLVRRSTSNNLTEVALLVQLLLITGVFVWAGVTNPDNIESPPLTVLTIIMLNAAASLCINCVSGISCNFWAQPNSSQNPNIVNNNGNTRAQDQARSMP